MWDTCVSDFYLVIVEKTMTDPSSNIVPKKRAVSPVWDFELTTKDKVLTMVWLFVTDVTMMFMRVVQIRRIAFSFKNSPSIQYTQVLQAQKVKAKENNKPSNASSSSANQGP